MTLNEQDEKPLKIAVRDSVDKKTPVNIISAARNMSAERDV